MEQFPTNKYQQGRDLILGMIFEGRDGSGDRLIPLGFSTGCKISNQTETGERVTKEGAAASKWKQKYVKGLSETINAEGFVFNHTAALRLGLPGLKEIFLNATEVTLQYQQRNTPEGQSGTTYRGKYIITSLEQDGQADDDEKWSVTFENSGLVAVAEPLEFIEDILN